MTNMEKETLAGEYALGCLDGDQRAHCDRLVESDPDFAARVESWRREFMEIDMTAAPERPSETLWLRIENALPETHSAMATPPARRTVTERRGWLRQLWENLSMWRAIGMSAAAACLVLSIGIALLRHDMAQTPIMVAVMMSDQNRPLALVNAFRDDRIELVPLEALSAPEGKSLQVWTLWDRGRGPVSVGLLEQMRSMNLNVSGLPATIPDQLFEVTLEPAGGSPTGRPTGPILMKGNASRTEVGI